MKRNTALFIIAAILGLLSLSACWREELVLNPLDKRAKPARLVVSARHGQETKTTVQDGGTHVLWDTDETIKLFGGLDQAALKSSNTEPAASTDFVGEMIYTQGEKLYALYPWREDAMRVNDTIITTLPFFQKARAGSFAKDMNLSVAESSSLEMTFMNVCGGVRFTLSNDNIYRIILESTGGEALAGKVWIRFDNGVPKVEKVEDECSRMILNVVDDGVFETGQWYYLVLLPGTVSQGVKLTFYTTDGKYGSVESPNALTIERGIFLGKENIDAGVTEWTLVDENSVEIKETSLEIEIPQETDETYLSSLKLSNYYGDYDFATNTSFNGVMRQNAESQNYSRVYDANYLYSGNGLMMQFLKNNQDEMVMCCTAVPGEKNTLSPENTVINMLMTSPLLITTNVNEYKATVAALKELDEFKALVRQAQTLVNNAMKKCQAPDYASLDLAPVKRALINKYFQTPDSQQGLDMLDINRDTYHRAISLKIRNHYRRVVHIYGRRAWMTENNLSVLRTEDSNPKLSEILWSIVQYGKNMILTPEVEQYLEFIPDQIDEGLIQGCADIMAQMHNDLSKIDIIPLPHVLVPESASYWKIVKGTWWDHDTSTPFEATTDDLNYMMHDADKLLLDIYGIGKMGDFSQYDEQEKLRIYAVLIHGAYNDFIEPLFDLILGIEEAGESSLDLRKGSKNAPMMAFLMELLHNLSLEDMTELTTLLTEGDLMGASEYAMEYLWKQLIVEANPIYYNLLYNTFKKYIFTQGSQIALEAFKTSLKSAFKNISLVGTTISISEKTLDVAGSVMAAACSDCKTTFVLDMDPTPSVTILAPEANAVIPGDQIDLSWKMHMGNRVGGVTFDIKVYEGHAGGLMVKSFREIAGNEYFIKLSDLPDILADEKLKIQVIAHFPNSPDIIYAQSDLIPIHIAAFRQPKEAVDLGLSVQWATCNVGASSPEVYGKYFAWGETVPKAYYDWSTYKWCNGDYNSLTKYNTKSDHGTVDNRTILQMSDDAARANWGDKWRMPTDAEWTELRTGCDWTWTTQNDVDGYLIKSKTNDNSIFLPAAGAWSDVFCSGFGSYRSSSLYTDYPDAAYIVFFESDEVLGNPDSRCIGYTVRPVYGDLVPVSEVRLNKTELSLKEGESELLTVTVLPDKAAEKGVTWFSSRPSVASIDEKGLVTALEAGTAVITVIAVDGDKMAECAVTVTAAALDEPEAVDLGLSVKWATCNVGANSPEEYGDYFAWGETLPKSYYNWKTYKWYNGSSDTLTKYNNSIDDGTVDNRTTLQLSDDAARAKWGGSWRMPTEAELTELKDNCDWTWTTLNGVNGYLVKSRTNSNSIFLPAAGYRNDDRLYNAGTIGDYWSSSLYTDDPIYAYGVDFLPDEVDRNGIIRFFGFTVRPVTE